MDVVRKLIEERLTELGLTMAEVSASIGRNPTYLHQFLKRGVPAELHERERIRLAEVLKVAENELRGPSTTLPTRGYGKKSLPTRESLVANTTQTQLGLSPGEKSPARVNGTDDLYGAVDLPVYGTSRSDRVGALIVSETAVDYVARPLPLRRVKDAYGLIVGTDLMSPEHKMGSIALVNPYLPPRIGDSCVFRAVLDHNQTAQLAVIKEFRGQTETHWKVHQHNPPRDMMLKIEDWPICQRIVGNFAS